MARTQLRTRRSTPTKHGGQAEHGSGWLELGCVLLLLIAAFAVRWRQLSAGFDREFAGYQGAFFAIAAIDCERLGIEPSGGYPAFTVDAPSLGDDDLVPLHTRKQDLLVYRNHPPLVPLLAWSSLKFFGPAGWSDAWRTDRAPQGIERGSRLPFFALHMFGLACFWWAMREGFGARTALIALALLAAAPVSILLGPHVNYENPSLPFVFLALGAYACYVREQRSTDLFGSAVSLAIGCGLTFAPLAFVPAIALHALFRKSLRFAFTVAPVLAIGAALPLVAHFLWSENVGGTAHLLGRAPRLLEPLLDGSTPLPLWLEAQYAHMRATLTLPLMITAAVGCLVALALYLRADLARWLAAREERADAVRVDIATPLLLGSLIYLLAFYRHSFEEQRIFMLYVAPGVAASAAVLIDVLVVSLLRTRTTTACVVLTGLLALPCLARGAELVEEARGVDDDAQLAHNPLRAAPHDSGSELASLLPAQSLGFYPAQLGLNLAPAFHAWRNFAPIRSPADLQRACDEVPHACERPVFLLLPRAEAESAAFAGIWAAFTHADKFVAQSEHWRMWRVESISGR